MRWVGHVGCETWDTTGRVRGTQRAGMWDTTAGRVGCDRQGVVRGMSVGMAMDAPGSALVVVVRLRR